MTVSRPLPSLPEWKRLSSPGVLDHDRKDLFAALVALITGRPNHEGRLAEHLAERFDSLASLLCAPETAWVDLPVSDVQLPVVVQLLRECALRYNRAAVPDRNIMDDEQRLMDYLMTRMAREPVEHFLVLFLDRRNRLLLDEIQAQGTINHTPVYPREIARRCLDLKAKAVILAHNHPSGDVTPSEADVAMTQHVQRALDLFGVQLLDHYIITREGHGSFRQMGLLDLPVLHL